MDEWFIIVYGLQQFLRKYLVSLYRNQFIENDDDVEGKPLLQDAGTDEWMLVYGFMAGTG